MIEITELSISEIDNVGGAGVHCSKQIVLVCNAAGECVPTSMVVCEEIP
jgi:hypothetical protein